MMCNETLRRGGTVSYSLERWCDVLDRGNVEGAALDHVLSVYFEEAFCRCVVRGTPYMIYWFESVWRKVLRG